MNFLSPQMKKPAANQAKAVVLPVACAGTAPAALAVDKGPQTILQASQVLSTYDVETNIDVNDLGILTLDRVDCPDSAQASVEEVYNQAVQHTRKNRLVAGVGGSHLVAEGLVRAALEQHTGLCVLHLGAHPHAMRGEAVGFDHDGCALFFNIGLGGIAIGKGSVGCRRDMVFLHEVFGEDLAALDDGGVGSGAEAGDTGFIQGIHRTQHQIRYRRAVDLLGMTFPDIIKNILHGMSQR